MKPKQSKRRLTAEQRNDKTLRRKARQAQQARLEKHLLFARFAEKVLLFSLILLYMLSFSMAFDRIFRGALSALLLLVEIFHLIILYQFKTLWKRQFIPILCTYACSAAMLAVFCTAQSAVFTPSAPVLQIFSIWSMFFAAWLIVILRQSENRLKRTIASALMALSLFSLCFFWADRVNISFDPNEPQIVAANILDFKQQHTGRGGTSSKIKVSFSLDDDSRTTHWFHILHISDYEQLISQPQLTLLRHEGAFSAVWYEIKLPK